MKLRARQIHLDFHTSELIPGVGGKFDKAQWQEAIELGHVNSITVFAKCHHSWSYYPTKVGQVHPTLTRDLMGEQIAACHEIGVRAPIYYTVGWSATDAEQHPDWLQRQKDGAPSTTGFDVNAKPEDKKPMCSWKNMCVGSPYRDLIVAQTEEICQNYPVDGFFYDIDFVNRQPCYCASCLSGMKALGIDPEDYTKALEYAKETWRALQRDTEAVIHKYHPEATIFYNGLADPHLKDMNVGETHFELEDLPTTWGGYDKMPPRARYYAKTGKQYLGMTGKFHTMWGEFGGFKHPEAMRFEAASMLAYGARCSIGDQLHPNGIMDMETYRLIGHAYSYIEEIEGLSLDTEPVANLGIFLSGNAASDEGLARMLLESQLDFKVIDDGDSLEGISTIVLPDSVSMDDTRAAYLKGFVEAGGTLLLSGDSGLKPDKSGFALDMGVEYIGVSDYDCDYLEIGKTLADGNMVTTPVLAYEPARVTRLIDGEVLAGVREPYFSRTYGHYCSHQNTPYREEAAQHPAAVRKGNIVYLAHPIFRTYYTLGAYFHRYYFKQVLDLIYQGAIFQADMPSSGRVTFNRQAEESRYVAHLLYASPLERGKTLVIEDTPALVDVAVSAEVPERIKRAYLAPQMVDLPFAQGGGRVDLVVPEVKCHQIVVLEY